MTPLVICEEKSEATHFSPLLRLRTSFMGAMLSQISFDQRSPLLYAPEASFSAGGRTELYTDSLLKKEKSLGTISLSKEGVGAQE